MSKKTDDGSDDGSWRIWKKSERCKIVIDKNEISSQIASKAAASQRRTRLTSKANNFKMF